MHLVCSAQLIYCKLGIPSPPRLCGLDTLSQDTRQLPIDRLSTSPNKPFSNCINWLNHPLRNIHSNKKVNRDDRAVLPARLRRWAFQLGSRSAILCTHCKRSLFLSFLSEIGSPRYVHDKKAEVQWNTLQPSCTDCSSQLMGMAQLLCMLAISPVAWPKQSRINFYTIQKSDLPWVVWQRGLHIAYMDNLDLTLFPSRSCSSPLSSAVLNKLLRTSITMTNNIGDKGSPWCNPLRCLIWSPGEPFNYYKSGT